MPRTPLQFDNSFARLPGIFYARQFPTPVAKPRLIRVNETLAKQLGIDINFLNSDAGLAMLSGNRPPEGSSPLAMVYAGHQFGYFVPQLGDGRANLIGEVIGSDGIRRDIQLKGSGPTPFSRSGDGRAALGPVLREYIVSEAMHALGVPTTRALAAVLSGEPVMRETLLPGAVLTRIAQSHIRVGTFQYFAARRDVASVKTLADYVIKRHYPDAAGTREPYRALLEGVLLKQAALIAKWISLGFIHGVMNTDNMSIAGETIDYGPCAFMDIYDPHAVFSSVDQMGRYAFGNQPGIAHWNLVQFAQCLLALLDDDVNRAIEKAQQAIDTFPDHFENALAQEFRKKLGLATTRDGDLALAQDLLVIMAEEAADFTLTFRSLAKFVERENALDPAFENPDAFHAWLVRWRARLSAEGTRGDTISAALNAANPALIARNHQVEGAIQAAQERDDFIPFEELLQALQKPFDGAMEGTKYALAPRPDERIHQTFCGT